MPIGAEEPESLEIEFMEAPQSLRRNSKTWRWEFLLRPVKAAPGSEARIRTHAKRGTADAEVRRIKWRLEQKTPMDKWRFRVRPLQDASAMYGIFATYQGVYTTREKQEAVIRSKEWSAKIKKARLANSLRTPRDNVSLIRPNPHA
jgi:hypothetical protein